MIAGFRDIWVTPPLCCCGWASRTIGYSNMSKMVAHVVIPVALALMVDLPLWALSAFYLGASATFIAAFFLDVLVRRVRSDGYCRRCVTQAVIEPSLWPEHEHQHRP